MKRSLLLSLLTLALNFQSVHAEQSPETELMEEETFKLSSVPFFQRRRANCELVTRLRIEVQGIKNIVRLENYVTGVCEIHVNPNPRSFDVTFEGTSCGSKIFTGTVETELGTRKLRIQDNRRRTCDDLRSRIETIEVDEQGFEGPGYSIDFPIMTCMAYWEGFVFDSNIGDCVLRGASGCSSPFRHKTLEACRELQLQK